MTKRITIAKKSDIPENEGRAFPVEDRMIAVFFYNGEYFAMDDFCPHQGAPLAAGWVHEGSVACPWHAWRFALKDGCWLDNPKIKTDVFPIIVEGEDLILEVDDE